MRLDPGDDRLDPKSKLIGGAVEGIGSDAALTLVKNKNPVHEEQVSARDHGEAVERALEWIEQARQPGILRLRELDVVGHRVVQGGNRFSGQARVDDDVIAGIESLEDLAPLHNAPALEVIRASRRVLGSETAMVAVFDTTFHRSIPEEAALYALPRELAARYGIRRYGFHGVSHEYMTRRYAQITGRPLDSVNIITLHLESGCSAAAIRAGKSVDTSMGFTPLEGLVMSTRRGDIDPAIVGFLARKEDLDVSRVEQLLNKQAGLLGLSGRFYDTRPLMQHYASDANAKIAMDVFCYRARKYVGAYLAALDGAEAIVFGGGIGEDTPFVRAKICEGFTWCGLMLDRELNENVTNRECRISKEGSRLHAYVIPVEEGLMIAHEAVRYVARTRAC